MKKQTTKSQSVRLIGGRWRGRKITFPEINDLRPTLGRTRETLFNWLRPEIAGTTCLDLFAGSGALGIEALSQGAGKVVLVENDATIFRSLEKNISELGDPTCQVIKTNALAYLSALNESFDIIFLDPPYAQPELLGACLELIARQKLVKKYVYLESNQAQLIEEICAAHGFELDRTTSGGNTFSALAWCKLPKP
jgi:16S rRNA (guanine966-N2)-methyltransferase